MSPNGIPIVIFVHVHYGSTFISGNNTNVFTKVTLLDNCFFQLVHSNLILDHLPGDLGQENEERRLNPVVYQESDNWTDELWAC